MEGGWWNEGGREGEMTCGRGGGREGWSEGRDGWREMEGGWDADQEARVSA